MGAQPTNYEAEVMALIEELMNAIDELNPNPLVLCIALSRMAAEVLGTFRSFEQAGGKQ